LLGPKSNSAHAGLKASVRRTATTRSRDWAENPEMLQAQLWVLISVPTAALTPADNAPD
jgi:hypothetical protein